MAEEGASSGTTEVREVLKFLLATPMRMKSTIVCGIQAYL